MFLKWNKWGTALIVGAMLLSGCGDDQEDKKEQQTETSDQQISEDQNEQMSENPSPLKEAENIPAEEKEAILKVVNQHIQAFNEKNIEKYMEAISKNSESFKYEDEEKYVKDMFTKFDMKMEPENKLIIGYNKKEKTANIYMDIKSTTKDLSSGKIVEDSFRQISIYKKEKDGWKLISTSAMK